MAARRRNPRISRRNVFLEQSERSSRERTKNLSFAQRRRRQSKEETKKRVFFLAQISLVLFLALFLTLSFLRGVRVSGPSMQPTLNSGDHVLVNRLAYRLHAPRRGDIVLFRAAKSQSENYSIKRVLAVPGDVIYISGGRIYVNNTPQRYSGISFSGITYGGRLSERLTLEADQYFVIGDNFNNSEDSRYNSVGLISRADFIGKVWFDSTLSHFGWRS